MIKEWRIERTSKIFMGVLLSIYLISSLAIGLSTLSAGCRVMLFLVLCLDGARIGFRRLKRSSVRIDRFVFKEGDWFLYNSQGDVWRATLLPSMVVLSYGVILRFRLKGCRLSRSFLIFQDNVIKPDDFRQLKFFLLSGLFSDSVKKMAKRPMG